MTARADAPTGRLAPSPTGLLHLGHARSFLLAWWSIRSRGGRIFLRMEDLDTDRVKPGMAEEVLRDLEWLGIDWDGPIVWQSQRKDLYASALGELAEAGLLYACTCTRKEVELAQSAPHLDDGTHRYPGTCRGRFASPEDARRETGREPALRLRVEHESTVTFVDDFAGERTEDVGRDVGDFPVAKRDGAAAYQLAVVVDDWQHGVTEVLRGEDLLASTGRQALLQRALGYTRPRWVHVPLVVDEAGRRLAKRTDDLGLATLRAAGVDPRAVVAWAAATSGIEGPARGLAEDYLAAFDLARVPPRAVELGAAEVEALRSRRV